MTLNNTESEYNQYNMGLKGTFQLFSESFCKVSGFAGDRL